MRRPKMPDIDPADLPPPNVIARQIAADLKAAQREIQAVIRSLEGSAERRESPDDGQLDLFEDPPSV